MQFEILGPLRITAAPGAVALTANRERTLLAMLLLHANRTVPGDQLVEAIWAADPPPGARNQLQGCVSRLRRRLASAGSSAGLIITDPDGYRAMVAPDELDLLRFRHHVAEARRTAGGADRTEAINHYRAALALWHGPALAGIDSDPIRRAATALDEEHLEVLEERIELELGTGAGLLVAELTDLVGRYPHREGLHRTLMLALYRTGRQADALAAYRRARQLLLDELGIEPGAELQRLHQAILNRDPALDTPPGAAPAQPQRAEPSPIPRELPADVAGFTGRDAALKTLDGMLHGPTAPVVITAIAGTAGVGKTALAVHWAHQVTDRFPDGQLYLNLRGYATDAPVRPTEALAALLRSLGIPPQQIPTEEAQAAALYRTQLADRRVLVVLDNAGTAGQVRPLLPGSPGCLVLITSRDRLAGLIALDGAHRLTLDVLTPEESTTLLTHLLGAERVTAEPAATTDLARACAHLPLAIRIAAAHLTDRPDLGIVDYLSELAREGLAALRIEGDEEGTVQTTFDLSYRRLPAEAARMFRLLGMVPGPDLSAAAAASLTDTTEEHAGQLLAVLASAHLVEQHRPGRYTFHDLLRLYLRNLSLTDTSEARAATRRLFDWYLYTADVAATLLYPTMTLLPAPPVRTRLPVAPVKDASGALAWLESERANLVAAILEAADRGPQTTAYLLADRLRGYFWQSGYTVDWLAVAHAGMSAAKRGGDLRAHAAAEINIASYHHNLASFQDAIVHYEAAATAASEAGWAEGRAAVAGNLGIVYWQLGQLRQAAVSHASASRLNRQLGRAGNEANNYKNLGLVYQEQGRLHQAAKVTTRALAIHRRLGQLGGEAICLHNLGGIDHDRGRLQTAYAGHTQALAINCDLGHHFGQGLNLDGLAAVERDAGNLASAMDHAQASVSMLAPLGDRRYEALVVNTLGTICTLMALNQEALDHHRHACDVARETGARRAEIKALIGLAEANEARGCIDLAVDQAGTATGYASEAGYRVHEGQAWTVLARLHLSLREYDQALEYVNRAISNHRMTGFRLGEARSLVILGDLRRVAEDLPAARRHWQAARDLFVDIGAPVPDEPTPVRR